MANTLWEWTNNGEQVTIYNQGAANYDKNTWEYLKTKYALTDDQLAKTLNNK